MENQPLIHGKYSVEDVFALSIDWEIEDKDLHGFDTVMFADFDKHGKKLETDDIVAAKFHRHGKDFYSIRRVIERQDGVGFKTIVGPDDPEMKIVGICFGYSRSRDTIRALSASYARSA